MSDYAPRMIRFVRANLDTANEKSTAEVEVETPGPGYFVGRAQGGTSEADQLRTVARATADALSESFDAHNAKVHVLAVRIVSAVPHNAIMVTLAASKGANKRTLIGICDSDSHNPAKAAALAVLNATNRFLSRR